MTNDPGDMSREHLPEDPVSTPSTGRSRRDLMIAIAPFVAIPAAIAAYVVGRAGVMAVLIGLMIVSVYLSSFVTGTAMRRTGLIPGVETNSAFFRRNVPLDGGWARLSAGRYLIAAGVLIVGGLVETFSPGWAAALYSDGSGWAWTLILVGSLLAMTAIVAVAPARDPEPTPMWGKVVSFVANGVGFIISAALVAAGIVELVSPGTIGDAIRDINPLG